MIEKNEEKKRSFTTYLVAIIPIVSFALVAIGSTYAFYLATVVGNEDYGDLELKSADVVAFFDNTDTLNVEKILPGFKAELNFSIYNSSAEENLYAQYTLMWDIQEYENEIDSNSFVYTLVGKSTKNDEVIEESKTNKVINVSSNQRIPGISSIIGSGMINSGVRHSYTLQVSFLENGENQNDLQGKRFKGRIVAKGEA